MAVVVTVTETFSATKVILTDTTGAYVAVTNPNGYGTPNAEFTDYGHYAIIRKKNVNSVADEVLTLDAYNPITDTEFTADRAVDGWYESKKLNIPIWLVGTSYTAGTLTTGSVVDRNGVPYYCIQSGAGHDPATPSSAYWTAVSDLTTIEDNSTITVTTKNRVTPYNADVYWSKAMAANSQKGLCGLAQDDRQKSRLDLIYFHIQCVLVADQLGSNTAGEWNSLTLQTMGAR
jgi:hypothetical protein